MKYILGDKVVVKNDQTGAWKAGTIILVKKKTKYNIQYDDGSMEYNVRPVRIRFLSTQQQQQQQQKQSVQQSAVTYKLGDKVVVKNDQTGAWKAGTIILVKKKTKYNIQYDDGSMEYNVRPVRIRFLSTQQQQQQQQQQQKQSVQHVFNMMTAAWSIT